MIKAQGDLLDMAKNGDFDIIIHGCNCWNVMGAGIAKQIRDQFRDAVIADSVTKAGDIKKLGNFTWAQVGDLLIINAYTQYHTSKTGEDVFEYDAFKLVLRKILHILPNTRIGLPYIGMGLAGGDAVRIMETIEWFATEMEKTGGTVTLVEYVAKKQP